MKSALHILSPLGALVVLLGCGPADAPAPAVEEKPFFAMSYAERAEKYDDLLSRAEIEASLANPRSPDEIWMAVVANRNRIRELGMDMEKIWKPEVEEIWRKFRMIHHLVGELEASVLARETLTTVEKIVWSRTTNGVRRTVSSLGKPAARYNVHTLFLQFDLADEVLLGLEGKLELGADVPKLIDLVSPKLRERLAAPAPAPPTESEGAP